ACSGIGLAQTTCTRLDADLGPCLQSTAGAGPGTPCAELTTDLAACAGDMLAIDHTTCQALQPVLSSCVDSLFPPPAPCDALEKLLVDCEQSIAQPFCQLSPPPDTGKCDDLSRQLDRCLGSKPPTGPSGACDTAASSLVECRANAPLLCPGDF